MTTDTNMFCKKTTLLWVSILTIAMTFVGQAQDKKDLPVEPMEDDYYKINSIPIPEGMMLGIGGIALLPNDKLAISTRRGEIWTISNPYMKNGQKPSFKLFAKGLHEPLGLAYRNGALYTAQRPELTRLKDLDGDGVADEYKTVYSLHLSGNYHEYAYGPVFDKDGNMIVTLNLAWNKGMQSLVKWRGWMLKISEEGKMEPFATGLRSPAAFGLNKDGDIFYAENQGGWIGSGYITALEKGDFASHPAGLKWSSEPGSSVKLKVEDIPDTGKPQFEVAKNIAGIKTPSVWIPHGNMGVSTSGMLLDSRGDFGPFKDQIFVGDQGRSLINRVFLEKVQGVYQGAVFSFVKGFASGVFRMCWGSDGSMFVGMTARGWGSTGGDIYGLQRLVWNGKVPFEIKEMRAMPDGFELEFTKPVDKTTASAIASYTFNNFTYKYHKTYGSPVIHKGDCNVTAIKISDDGTTVRIAIDNMKEGFIHEVNVNGIRSEDEKHPVLHPVGYYTLNKIPDGNKLETQIFKAAIQKNKLHVVDKKENNTKTKQVSEINKKKNLKENNTITLEQIRPLLIKHTCVACHDTDKKQVGPSFKEIAKRKYSADKMAKLIYEPQPENWPDYATPMPPMTHVPKEDVDKIVSFIKSLE
ncbi:c-type cytochrome [Mariniflexile sp. AS56]|uniref:DUF7133 domain-containing protein n=1 Tax=Mariniflexile sp. AS56 TaxID=3063957 RepID=UPI0026EE2901|nr:c-type cytochrome [Mariniflexile sp. AS56]MDO7172497.1 auracyanin family protein [Mariniflexile sp. AS56]